MTAQTKSYDKPDADSGREGYWISIVHGMTGAPWMDDDRLRDFLDARVGTRTAEELFRYLRFGPGSGDPAFRVRENDYDSGESRTAEAEAQVARTREMHRKVDSCGLKGLELWTWLECRFPQRDAEELFRYASRRQAA